MRRSIVVDMRERTARGVKEGSRVSMTSAADPAMRRENERKGSWNAEQSRARDWVIMAQVI